MLRAGVITLFPQMFDALREYGVVARGIERELLRIECWNPRDYATDRHRTVDDRPYGGGPGMVMKYGPLARAIDAAGGDLPTGCPVIGLTPQGRVFDQAAAARLAGLDGFVLVAGRYEGIDERLVGGRGRPLDEVVGGVLTGEDHGAVAAGHPHDFERRFAHHLSGLRVRAGYRGPPAWPAAVFG